MNDITFIKTPPHDLTGMKRQYLNTISAPLDGMWETFTHMADHYTLLRGGNSIGFCAVNAEQKMMQFYAPDMPDAASIFAKILTELQITGAMVSTAEPAYLSHCLDHHQSVTVNALMYHVAEGTQLAEAQFPAGTEFRLIAKNELDIAVAFGIQAIGADEAWITDYYSDHIAREQLYGLWYGTALIAVGELRISISQKPYVDVGMVVLPNQRDKGIATNILRQLRRLARENGLKAICSTEHDNIAAQKAIIRAGFVSDHRVLNITF